MRKSEIQIHCQNQQGIAAQKSFLPYHACGALCGWVERDKFWFADLIPGERGSQ